MIKNVGILTESRECPFCSAPGFTGRKPCRSCGVVIPSKLTELGTTALVNRALRRRALAVASDYHSDSAPEEYYPDHEEAIDEAA